MTNSHILIVDDSPQNIHLLAGMLETQQRVFFATTGAQGLQMAEQHPVDLVLLDVVMKEMDGYQVCRKLKQAAATRDIPVLFMSALQESADKVKGFAAGGWIF